jgi:hypothetical protein
LFNIELGPHFLFSRETYTLKNEYVMSYEADELQLTYFSPGLHTGFNFVKRIHPLKINAGIFLNVSIPIIAYTIDSWDTDGYSYENSSARVAVKAVPGVRAGAEILASPNVGFSLDFVFQYIKVDIDYDFDEMDITTDDDDINYSQDIIYPKFAIGLGVNFYY